MLNVSKITAIVAFFAVASTGSIAAAETVNHPGSKCAGASGTNLFMLSNGQAENRATSTLTAMCPIERTVAPSLETELSGRVFVVDQHPSQNACCRAVSQNPGGAHLVSSWTCSSGSSTGYQILDLGTVTDAYSYSHFMLECTLPPMYGSTGISRIQTYRSITD